jgi:hypothetical protein
LSLTERKQIKKCLLNPKVRDEQKSLCKCDFEAELYGPSMILSDSTLKLLASADPISSLAGLEQVMGKELGMV